MGHKMDPWGKSTVTERNKDLKNTIFISFIL